MHEAKTGVDLPAEWSAWPTDLADTDVWGAVRVPLLSLFQTFWSDERLTRVVNCLIKEFETRKSYFLLSFGSVIAFSVFFISKISD